jgi:hypothetical protein
MIVFLILFFALVFFLIVEIVILLVLPKILILFVIGFYFVLFGLLFGFLFFGFDSYVDLKIQEGLTRNGGDFDGATINFGDGHKVYIEGPKSSAGKFVKSLFGKTEYSVKYYINEREEAKFKITGEDELKITLRNIDFFKFTIKSN